LVSQGAQTKAGTVPLWKSPAVAVRTSNYATGLALRALGDDRPVVSSSATLAAF
jgi:ABC-type Fe2+-enterobactin transport system substrate-binding protein